MALITVSGYPCSGKSTRAQELMGYLNERLSRPDYMGPKLKVVVVSDDSLNIKRNVYDDSRSEKPARSALFTALTRELGQDTILIVDGMNYIKGFRYQLYCAAREAEVRPCTLYVVATPELCRERNLRREEALQYTPTTFENLIVRYEEPNSMARWDAPLYTVLWTDEHLPVEAVWATVTAGAKAPTNVSVIQTIKPPTDALQTLEATSAKIVSLIASSSNSLDGAGGALYLDVSSVTRLSIMVPPRSLTLAELQRHKRQFVTQHKKTITQGVKGGLDWSEVMVARKFVDYLEEHLRL